MHECPVAFRDAPVPELCSEEISHEAGAGGEQHSGGVAIQPVHEPGFEAKGREVAHLWVPGEEEVCHGKTLVGPQGHRRDTARFIHRHQVGILVQDRHGKVGVGRQVLGMGDAAGNVDALASGQANPLGGRAAVDQHLPAGNQFSHSAARQVRKLPAQERVESTALILRVANQARARFVTGGHHLIH